MTNAQNMRQRFVWLNQDLNKAESEIVTLRSRITVLEAALTEIRDVTDDIPALRNIARRALSSTRGGGEP